MSGMLAVDVGGTFTDVIGFRDGRIEAVKVPTDPERTEESVLAGARALGANGRTVFNHASTVGLNAVLTRRLPKVALLTTSGHRDVLDIARCWRPLEALTDAGWRRSFGDSSRPLVPRYLRRGIHERITADGQALIELDEDQAGAELERLRRCDVEGVAICLLNAYVNPAHERRLRELVADVLGEIPCSMSSAVSPLAKEYARASTTVIDVFMKLIYAAYAEQLDGGLRAQGFDGHMCFADSAATLLEFDYAMRTPFRLVFSGPAAGAMASAHFGALIGDERLLCCDVGGTSSDISIVSDGHPQLDTTFELEPDLLVNALSVELGTLGAGGGSIVSVTSAGEIRVGPESAGGEPGPACYGRGGTAPTMTDAFLAMGILDPERFNAGRMRLDPERSLAAFRGLDGPLPLEQRISYAYRIGLNNIREGLVDVAVARGLDLRDFSLMAFGAAGPLMLPAVLDQVGARRVIVPPYPGLFSALGLLSTDRVYSDSQSAYLVLTPESAPLIREVFERMEAGLREQLPAGAEATVKRTFDGRLVGQSWDTPFVGVPDGAIDEHAVVTMIARFHDEYELRYGNRFDAMPVEGVTYRVQLIVGAPRIEYPTIEAGGGAAVEPDRTIELRCLDERNRRAGEHERERLRAGDVVRGPAIVREPTSTTHLLAGQRATVGGFGELVIERDAR
jgi:N-methylhydantoinase A